MTTPNQTMPDTLYINEPVTRPDGSLMYEGDASRFHARHKYTRADAPQIAEKLFPVQRYGGKSIPWSVAEKAYEVYSRKYGSSQSLERLAERGGFGVGEMDEFYPNWRNEVEEIPLLKKRIAELEAATQPKPQSEIPSRDVIDDIARECLQMLAPWDVRGEPNTLWALTKKVTERLAKFEKQLTPAITDDRQSALKALYQIQCQCTLRERDSGHRTDCDLPQLKEVIEAALTVPVAREVEVVKQIKEYYLPQLKFSMKNHRESAKSFPINESLHNGAANAFEVAIGCIEEALALLGGKAAG